MYTCNAKALTTDTADFVTEADLKQGKQLIWKHKGTPYTVELKKVHGRWDLRIFIMYVALPIDCYREGWTSTVWGIS